MTLAAIRPDSVNLPLFVHVFGAMVLVGGLLVTSTATFVARDDVRVLRIGYKALLLVCLPGYIVMRVGAEWIYSREHLGDVSSDPAWIGIGYIVADGGALLLLIALILGGIGIRRARSGATGMIRASIVLSVVLLAAAIVAIWAMGAKPV